MSRWSVSRVADTLGVPRPAGGDAAVAGFAIDTRTLTPGDAYVAIVGQRLDGHAFVHDAFQRGAAVAIVSQPVGHAAGPVVVVPDTVAALQALAATHRADLRQAGVKVVAVAGSNGKTTTRHLLHHVLTAAGLPGSQSPKSFNNHLGVPLTLLAASTDHRFVAAELGTNHPGEIAGLSTLTQPDAAIITSIGAEHLEFFKDLAGVAREEASLLPHVAPGGLVVTTRSAGAAMMPWYDVAEGVAFVTADDDRAVPHDLPLPGAHNRRNAALVAVMARWMGTGDDAITAGLRTAAPPTGRLRIETLGGNLTLIDDTYNANPDSTAAALDVLAAMPVAPGGRRIAVLGDMLELGDAGPAAHAEIARRAAQVADEVRFIGTRYPDARPWTDHTPADLADLLRPGDTVLLKASRGLALERLIPTLRERFGPADGSGPPINAEGRR